MMKHLSYGFILLGALLLSACASLPNGYHEPASRAPYASIHGWDKVNNYFPINRKGVQIASIDGRPIGTLWSASSSIKLSPGFHQVETYVFFVQGHVINPSDTQTATLSLGFNALAGEEYSIATAINQDRISAWIVDSHHRAVSKIMNARQAPAGAEMIDVPEMKR